MSIQFVSPGYRSVEGGAGVGDTITLTNTTGNLLVAVCGDESTAGNITGITDTASGNMWVALAQQANPKVSRCFYCLSCTTSTLHTVAFTVSGTQSSFAQMAIAEFSGANTYDTNSSQSTSASPGIATAAAAEVVIGFTSGTNGVYGAGTGWSTAVGNTVPTTAATRLGIIYQIESSQNTYTPLYSAAGDTWATLGFYYVAPLTFIAQAGAFCVGP